MPYVYSTLTCDNEYAHYVTRGDQQSVEHKVFIKGGHGVMNKNFLTPLGVATEVSDEDLAFLKTVPAFQSHVDGGFLTYEEKKVEPEKVAANMKRRDKSSQLTPADYEPGGQMAALGAKEPTVSGVQ